ncbi:MAG: DUF1566 domain-containing protein [Polyangiaceae bacterium]|nr:DUF1566 domain-containing protein [Polyangiaceae bacterium]MCW5792054.1 DUF1566 domain-containing protein [Polyangiaceae bacterium]
MLPWSQDLQQGQVEVCSEDGLTVIERRSCSAAQGCEEGECRPLVCEPGTSFCRGDKLIQCSASGTSEQEQACGVRAQCVDDVGGAKCAAWVCEPGVSYCEGAVPRSCAADGLSYTQGTCGDSTTCSAGVCEPWLCAPSTEFCDGDQPKACALDGLGSTDLGVACPGEVGCSDGKCCTPNERLCVGDRVLDCAADGRGMTEVETCAASQFCVVGACLDEHDGHARWPIPGTPRYPFDYTVDASAKTVLDNVTGLLWQQEPASDTHTLDGARGHCEGLTWGGRDDWRLPTRMELMSLVNQARPEPTLDSVAFPGTPGEEFWAGPRRDTDGWTVNFRQGNVRSRVATGEYRVRCVAEPAAQPPIPPSGNYFEVTGNTAIDSATSLEWQRATAPNTLSRAAGMSYCDDLDLDGKDDWRLPTVAELGNLIPGRKLGAPLIDVTTFPASGNGSYWSATGVYGDTGRAWEVSFSAGVIQGRPIGSTALFIRCVRDL